ncbi:UNVERIFIED_CONTAM: hypothetical protein Slati_2527600 [Sesamum latifolium]|uniref:Uncharacterized protein n=1 Tax=Sesamum latifolium TaxID=2727402 RepID=A0AAW2WIG4_9LAMI
MSGRDGRPWRRGVRRGYWSCGGQSRGGVASRTGSEWDRWRGEETVVELRVAAAGGASGSG